VIERERDKRRSPQVDDREGEGQKERNWKYEGELLIALSNNLWNVAHEKCMAKDKLERKRLTTNFMDRCNRNMVSQGTITKANGKF